MSVTPEESKRIYEAAHSLRPAAEAIARRMLLPDGTAEESLMQAVTSLLKHHEISSDVRINNLRGYLLIVYKNLLRDELKRKRREINTTDEFLEAHSPPIDPLRSMEDTILVSEIVESMSPQTRNIFGYLSLGWTYEEIASEYLKVDGKKVTAATLRSNFNKNVKRIARELAEARSVP